MIDLHSHILPDLDDGAGDLEVSLRMARIAVEDGVQTMVATPHVNFDYPVDAETVLRRVGELNVALARAGIALAVLPGAEISMARAADMTDEELASFALAGGRTVLVESPYVKDVAFAEDLLFDLQLRGFTPLLAHPERSPMFQTDIDRLRRLVARDVRSSVNAGSLGGRFGRRTREAAIEIMRAGLAHDIASDSHDESRRPPGLRAPIAAADEFLPGLLDAIDWYTRLAPAALLSSRKLPERPALAEPEAPQGRFRRMLGRTRE